MVGRYVRNSAVNLIAGLSQRTTQLTPSNGGHIEGNAKAYRAEYNGQSRASGLQSRAEINCFDPEAPTRESAASQLKSQRQ